MNEPHVSLICTVLNEGDAIRRLLDSMVAQTRQPDEVIIVDGGSRDNTVAVIQAYADHLPLRVLVEPGANISRGRNVAIAAATGEIIAATDAGVWLEPVWLEKLLESANQRISESTNHESVNRRISESTNRESRITNQNYSPFATAKRPFGIRHALFAIAGFFLPDTRTTFEIAMGATVLPALEDVKPASFLPSSRSVAFTKAAWEAAGGYPEWLDYCEDLIFDFRLQEVAGPFAWAPKAVAHFRPRSTLKTFFKQYYRYARGDGKADLWRKRHLIRYATYLIALPGLLALSILHTPAWLLLLLAGVLFYCATPYRRLRPHLPGLAPGERIKAVLWVPIIRAVGDIAKMLGYPAGWVWRLRNWARAEIHWRTPKPATPN